MMTDHLRLKLGWHPKFLAFQIHQKFWIFLISFTSHCLDLSPVENNVWQDKCSIWEFGMNTWIFLWIPWDTLTCTYIYFFGKQIWLQLGCLGLYTDRQTLDGQNVLYVLETFCTLVWLENIEEEHGNCVTNSWEKVGNLLLDIWVGKHGTATSLQHWNTEEKSVLFLNLCGVHDGWLDLTPTV